MALNLHDFKILIQILKLLYFEMFSNYTVVSIVTAAMKLHNFG